MFGRRTKTTALRALLACASLVAVACGTEGDTPSAPQPRGTACPGFAHGPRDGFPVDFGEGDLAEAVATYVAAIKGAGSGDYRPPTASERTGFAKAWTTFSDLPAQRAALDKFGYDLFLFDDTAPGLADNNPGRWTVACERRNGEGTWDRGWGLYLNNNFGFTTIVEVPHPKFDRNSADVGVAIGRKVGGELLIAGAHRHANGEFDDDECTKDERCSDMSHQPNSVFQAVHDALINPPECVEEPLLCRTTREVVQPHGFATNLHQGIGHIAISDGVPDAFHPDSLIAETANRLEGAGFQVCRFQASGDCAGTEADGSPGTSLGATKNVQGISTRKAVIPVSFMHIEVSREVRDKVSGDLSRRLVGDVVGTVLKEQGPAG
jgi:hypothetical protein